MKYALSSLEKPLNAAPAKDRATFRALKKFLPLIAGEQRALAIAFAAMVLNSAINLAAPRVIAHAVDTFIPAGDFSGVVMVSLWLLGLYVIGFFVSYAQTRLMGGVGQRVLYALRNRLFEKIQSLPVAFFNENKAGDLISRINNDTDKLNQFFSQSLMQFVGSIVMMAGSAVFLLSLGMELGLAALAPALFLLLFTQLVSPWVKRKNTVSLQAVGGLSAEIQQSMDNFKVIVAFDRRDYFRKRFAEFNQQNYQAAVGAGIANNAFTPVYGLLSMLAQLIVLALGIHLILQGQFTVGLLISAFAYVTTFYNPLRQLAALWSNFQVAMAGWDRISEILSLESNVAVVPQGPSGDTNQVLAFDQVSFGYTEGKDVLKDVSFALAPGKTYALVGPTGGGKTTTASLMARLYDPIRGTIFLHGRDIRSFTEAERAREIGFILQEPFLFSGTVRDNLLYGNAELGKESGSLEAALKDLGLNDLLTHFDKGLDTPVSSSGDTMSLGQRQIVAFVRAILRRPSLLILDEATANIDTVTEQLLEEILQKLPTTTTRIIIAHRLNTIANADEIFFVNAGTLVQAGSMEHAVEMLLHGKRTS